jgi:hypothetical protein
LSVSKFAMQLSLPIMEARSSSRETRRGTICGTSFRRVSVNGYKLQNSDFTKIENICMKHF